MAKDKEKKSYSEALQELEELVKKIESPDTSLADIGDELKRGMELIKYCKKELKGYEDEFEKIVTE